MARPLFSLDARLDLCARLVRPGKNLCDVGADHGYLSIWLLRTGKTPRALATDLRAGPLAAAAKNAARYGVEDRLALRLTDGLDGVLPEDAEDFVLAGMGGETILAIIARVPWLRDEKYRLVLQPMSSADSLRVGLRQLGFALLEEQAVLDSGRRRRPALCGKDPAGFVRPIAGRGAGPRPPKPGGTAHRHPGH